MSDRELWEALSVIARRMGLIERGQRITIEGDPRDETVPAPPKLDSRGLSDDEHRAIADKMRAERLAMGTVCGAPSPLQPGPDCVYRVGHRGAHSNDPERSRE